MTPPSRGNDTAKTKEAKMEEVHQEIEQVRKRLLDVAMRVAAASSAGPLVFLMHDMLCFGYYEGTRMQYEKMIQEGDTTGLAVEMEAVFRQYRDRIGAFPKEERPNG